MIPEAKLILFKKKAIKLGCKKEKIIEGPLAQKKIRINYICKKRQTPNMTVVKQEPLFDLIRGMNKAEKRNFKLYANRHSAKGDAKFVILFDTIESLDHYDEAKILRRCNVKKEQLPNMKAHLYRQILVSIRLLSSQHSVHIQIREYIDFAKILYDKSLFRQSLRMLDKAKQLALTNECYSSALEVVEFEKKIEGLHMTRSAGDQAGKLSKQSNELMVKIDNINKLSNLAIQLYFLNLKLGYIRSEKDSNLVTGYFKNKLNAFDPSELSFHERLYYYQVRMWYSYIQHDFLRCYRYAQTWVSLFEENQSFKATYYDHYIRACSRLLDVLFMTRQYTPMVELIAKVERELYSVIPSSDNATIMSGLCLLFAKINVHFMDATFAEGVSLAADVDHFVERWKDYLDEHYRMMLFYKIACMYFGNGDYKKCKFYLQKIISVRDPQFRRDLQCFARILHLIASYDSGDDYSLEYQMRSVYSFIVKMNDMHAVQQEIMAFLRRLPRTYASNFREELVMLREKLLPYENHPYERRPFFYLDIISWLDSKIDNVPIAEVIKKRFAISR